MPREAKRRFLGLDVDEVSAVDSPANEREFLVLKNMEENEMPEGTTETREETNTNAAVERVAVEAPSANAEVVSKALGEVNKIVDSIVNLTKATPEPAAAKEEPAKDDDVEKAKGKGKFPKAMFRSMMEKAGVSKEAIPALLAGIEKEFDSSEATQTKKSADEEPEEEATETETSPAITLEMLQKAAALSPERVAALQTAFETLKLVIEAIAPNATPKTKVPGSNSFGASGVRELTNPSTTPTVKSADGDIVKALEGVTSVLKALNERVESIEKERPASNSDGDDEATNEPTQKNFWNGVI